MVWVNIDKGGEVFLYSFSFEEVSMKNEPILATQKFNEI